MEVLPGLLINIRLTRIVYRHDAGGGLDFARPDNKCRVEAVHVLHIRHAPHGSLSRRCGFRKRLRNLCEGFKGQPLPDNRAVVQLDVTVLPELEREGVARDFVRMVQQLRKDKGLDVSDRISLTWESESALVKEAFKEHAAYIADQVLATSFVETANTGKTEELGDSTVVFSIEKV